MGCIDRKKSMYIFGNEGSSKGFGKGITYHRDHSALLGDRTINRWVEIDYVMK